MNVLAFESSNFRLTVALMKNNLIVGCCSCDDIYQQDSQILPLIQQLLTQNNLSLSEMDYIATCTGPGSFTGIRMSVAICSAFGIALSIPIVGITAFDSIYEQYLVCNGSNKIRKVLVMLESKRSELYCRPYLNASPGDVFMDNLSNINRFIIDNDVDTVISNTSVTDDYFKKINFKLIPFIASDLCNYVKKHITLDNLNDYPCHPFYHRKADVCYDRK